MSRSSPFGSRLHWRSHEVVLGVPGAGKTTFVREVLTANARRCVFFDPTGDYESTAAELVDDPADLLDFPELLRGSFVRVVVRAARDESEGEDPPDAAEQFRTVVRACRRAGRVEGLLLVADEVKLYGGGGAGAGAGGRAMCALHLNAHHDGVASVLVAQRATHVPTDCRSSATAVHSFLQVASADLDALRAEYGEDYAAKVAAWKPGSAPVTWRLPTLK